LPFYLKNTQGGGVLDNFRICKSCIFEFVHAEGIFQEIYDNKEKLTYSFWKLVILHGGLGTLLFDINNFPVSNIGLKQFIESLSNCSIDQNSTKDSDDFSFDYENSKVSIYDDRI
jgi:hypothetical protein